MIVVGHRATETEQHAAEEMARYLKDLTSTSIPVESESNIDGADLTSLVLIGTPETHRLIHDLGQQEKILLSRDEPGHDGFIIKSVSDAERHWLVIGSAVPRGCLFGVYHFLETEGGVGFHWDGDFVPKGRTPSFWNLDVAERPHFPDREYIQACAYGYTAMFWDIDNWKRELDWAVRKKFNLIQITFAQAVPRYNAMKAMGVEMPEPSPWERHEMNLAIQINRYARQLGLRVIHPAFDGTVPPQFKEHFPDLEYVVLQWLDFPPYPRLSPSDPMFVEFGARFINEHTALCGGTDHYYNIDPYPETDPGETPEAKRRVKVDFAKALVSQVKRADPQGKWVISGWAFTYEDVWTPSDVEAFLEVIPKDMFLVNDIWAEENPIHKKFNYFHGRNWGFSVLHSMGGWTTVHGDLQGLIDRMQDVAVDRKAGRCTNFYLNPEILHHNDVYFELAIELGWNPARVELDGFMDRFLARRYGAALAPPMRPAWDELIASVYSEYDFTAPAYQPRPNLKVPESYKTIRKGFAPRLRRALELALVQSNTLRDNNFYQRDIVDIARQYVAETFNRHYITLVDTFKKGDRLAFEKVTNYLKRCLRSQEKILASHREFSMAPEVESASRLPKFYAQGYQAANPLANNAQVIRMRYTALGGLDLYPTLIDYARKDLYELVKFYYHPRFDLFVNYLRERLDRSEPFDFEEIDKQYRSFVEEFVLNPHPEMDPADRAYVGDPCRAAREILSDLSR